jgi:hypothetical protein
MAQGFRFVCDKCDHIIVAWDDGNPYYIESVITKAGEVKQKKIRPPSEPRVTGTLHRKRC